jgi:hypothetical protein
VIGCWYSEDLCSFCGSSCTTERSYCSSHGGDVLLCDFQLTLLPVERHYEIHWLLITGCGLSPNAFAPPLVGLDVLSSGHVDLFWRFQPTSWSRFHVWRQRKYTWEHTHAWRCILLLTSHLEALSTGLARRAIYRIGASVGRG